MVTQNDQNRCNNINKTIYIKYIFKWVDQYYLLLNITLVIYCFKFLI